MPQETAVGPVNFSPTILLTSFASFTRTQRDGVLRSSLLPAATEGLIDLDKSKPLVELRLNEIQLRRKIICFGGQHLQIARTALLIEHQGEVVRSLSCLSEQLLLTAKVTKFLITNEGIRNLL